MTLRLFLRLRLVRLALTVWDREDYRLSLAEDLLRSGRLPVSSPIFVSVKLPAGYSGSLSPPQQLEIVRQARNGVLNALEEEEALCNAKQGAHR